MGKGNVVKVNVAAFQFGYGQIERVHRRHSLFRKLERHAKEKTVEEIKVIVVVIR